MQVDYPASLRTPRDPDDLSRTARHSRNLCLTPCCRHTRQFPSFVQGPHMVPSPYQRNSSGSAIRLLSDRGLPPPEQLRADEQPYTNEVQNYRGLPASFDPRIAQLAAQVTANAKNRYDKALATERYLQTNFGYTLEQRSNGDEPLSSFLFDIREGHCEYFATAMAVMLRTQGIATRIVNGFHGGEYNDAADVTVVRQRNAHAWVEVFFPKRTCGSRSILHLPAV